MSIYKEPFGTTAAGEVISKYTMVNRRGMRVCVLDYAGVIQAIHLTDRDQEPVDVVLGYDTIEEYEKGDCFFGAFVGRYANRIKGASFELNGETYTLPKNDGNNHLHGVLAHRKLDAEIYGDSLIFTGVSPDGEEGFPGNLTFSLSYTITDDNRLMLDYRAVTDKETVVNFTNHTYFNLSGHDSGDVLDQELRLAASTFTEGDAETLPTGKILSVEGTPFDFREAKAIGANIHDDDIQLKQAGGYDHNFIFDAPAETEPAAEAFSPKTGITLRMYTTQPATQLYTGNFVHGTGKGGAEYGPYSGFCLESQHYPCSPNFPDFPSTVLKPGETYHQVTAYKFGRRDWTVEEKAAMAAAKAIEAAQTAAAEAENSAEPAAEEAAVEENGAETAVEEAAVEENGAETVVEEAVVEETNTETATDETSVEETPEA